MTCRVSSKRPKARVLVARFKYKFALSGATRTACLAKPTAFSCCPSEANTLANSVYPLGSRGVVLNQLLTRLGRFIFFSGDSVIVVGGDLQFFPFAGMVPQLERLGEYSLARPGSLRLLYS